MGTALLSRVEDKFLLLLKKMQSLAEENGRLQAALGSLEEQSARQLQKITELEASLHLLKVTGPAAGDGKEGERRKQLRSTINRYIREIDHCIAQLNE